MAQEIITYLIVAAAFLFAFWKFYKKFSKKKKRDNKLNNEQQQKQHNCSACSAECILRDKSTSSINNADFCNKTYTGKD